MTEGGQAVGRSGGQWLRGVGRGLLAVALLAAGPPDRLAAQSKHLAKRLDARLDAAPFNHLQWGVALADEQGKLLYARNADRLFIPASNTKLVVSAVAAAMFDPDFTVATSAYGGGPVVDGTLQGSLVLYGRGDPTFSRRCYSADTTGNAAACMSDAMIPLRALARSLKSRGIRVVAGDVVGDGSYFEPMLVHNAWESYDLNWWYAAPVSGLGFNDNSIDIGYGPGATAGAPATLSFTPDFGDVRLENRTRTTEPGADDTIDFFRVPGTLDLWAQGTVATGSRGGVEHFALPDPNLYTARAFRTALAEEGIAVTGATVSTLDSTRYAPARLTPPLAEVVSRPLRDWIFPILNTSQNWFAEMLLKQLGRRFGRAGSWDEGLAVERRFLIDSVKVDSTQLALVDGSGLASANLLSPVTFTQLLRFMRRHPHWEAFAAGLPQAGRTGSLRDRFGRTPLDGRVRAKTGSIVRVNALSGYVELPNGRTLTFAVVANNHALRGSQVTAQIDSVVVEMARGMER
jgi:D-alanyl-D-alanine carboxypeptidase/D-alanyl-D-alanine-endopeptidase (penicillin-binding protein 4)